MKKSFLFLWLLFYSGLCFSVERANVCVIFSSEIEPYKQNLKGFKEYFREKNVALWISEYNLEKQELETIYSQINKKKPDLIFVLGTKAARLVKKRTEEINVVFSMIIEPEKIVGLNFASVSMDIPVSVKLAEIKKILPNVKKVGLIYSPEFTLQYDEISRISKNMGFQIIGKEISLAKEFPCAVKEISEHIDCFLMLLDSKIYFSQSVQYLLLESLRKKFAVIGLSSQYTEAGALISFDCDYKDLGRQAGEIALRILDGEKPCDIRQTFPEKIKISLNLITAERLGIKISRAIINEADKIFNE
ncbi:MAG: ABC transporter substrate-binding protein [Elusimicrobiota bacterium]